MSENCEGGRCKESEFQKLSLGRLDHFQPLLIEISTFGQDFILSPIHAGGLRYHGASPIISLLHNREIIDSKAYYQNETFAAAVLFAQAEGFLVAPESAYAVKAVIDDAIECRKTNEEKVIVFNNNGHGYFDLAAYKAYHERKQWDYEYPAELVNKAMARLPKI